MIEYRETAPPRGLDPYVECEWSVQSPRGHDGYLVMPDGCVDVVWRNGQPSLIGTMTKPERVTLAPGERVDGIRFRPGMFGSFQSHAMTELVDRDVPIATFEYAQPPPLTPVQKALAFAASRHGQVDLDRIISASGFSSRQFRRISLQLTGVSPKYLLRLLRFRHSWAIAQRGSPDWAAIAARCGYFDQAHLIRDYQEFTGMPPMAVFSNTRLSAGDSIRV